MTTMKATLRSVTSLFLVALCAFALGGTVLAHHSQSQFDPQVVVTIEGTLTKASWSNPHTLFFVDGRRVGTTEAVQLWSLEGPAPRQLEARGWGRAVSKPGDKITFSGRPRRDGKPELLLLSVTLEGGKLIEFKPE